MHAQHLWQSFDRTMRDKFEGKYGEALFREVVTFGFMATALRLLKAKIEPQLHPELNKNWYGSMRPSHPFHSIRSGVENKIGDFADAMIAHSSSLQQKFAWFDAKARELEHYINELLEIEESRSSFR